MALGGNRGLLLEWTSLVERAEPAAVAVVVGTRGSTYRKPGALVLVDAKGVRSGSLSGGCLEPALEERAREVIVSRRAAPLSFDTDRPEDLVFGSGVGCRGVVDAALLPVVPSSTANLLVALARAEKEARALHVSLDLRDGSFGAGTAWADGWRMAWDREGRMREVDGEGEGAVVRIRPAPRVALLGGGPETAPFVAIARGLGWHVTVVDHRARWAEAARAAEADVVVESFPREAFEALSAARVDAVIAMSHSFEVDRDHLQVWRKRQVGFVGVVGPVARRQELLAELGAVASEFADRLRGPVGLPLGGDGAEVVALSIAADLQRHFAGGRGD